MQERQPIRHWWGLEFQPGATRPTDPRSGRQLRHRPRRRIRPGGRGTIEGGSRFPRRGCRVGTPPEAHPGRRQARGLHEHGQSGRRPVHDRDGSGCMRMCPGRSDSLPEVFVDFLEVPASTLEGVMVLVTPSPSEFTETVAIGASSRKAECPTQKLQNRLIQRVAAPSPLTIQRLGKVRVNVPYRQVLHGDEFYSVHSVVSNCDVNRLN